MKKIYALILLTTVSIASVGAMDMEDVKEKKIVLGQRTKEIQKEIDQAFQSIPDSKVWPHNGKKKYNLFGIDDKDLLRIVVSQSKDENIYIIDAGCANADWGKSAIKFLNSQEFKNLKKRFYIFSITGGKECLNKTESKGNITHYQINSFKIENIDEEFEKRNLSYLKDNVDLIVSSVTLKHLVDSFGTIKRMYKLLSSKSNGILIADCFCFKFAKNTCFVDFPIMNLNEEEWGKLLAFSGAACLFCYRNYPDINHFILMKLCDRSLEISLKYSGLDDYFMDKNKRVSFKLDPTIAKQTYYRFSKKLDDRRDIIFYGNSENPKKCVANKILLKFFTQLDEFGSKLITK